MPPLSRTMAIALALAALRCSEGGVAGSSDDPAAHLGAACTHASELDAAFGAFSIDEVAVERGSPECGTGACLVNHFQGRSTCPLGQAAPMPCKPGDACPGGGACVPACSNQSASCPYVCHTSGSCQSPTATAAANSGKACCVLGSDTPVTGAVCGECEHGSHRDAADAVYCSCRCGVAVGAPEEPDTLFCKCATGFECVEVVKFTGTGNTQLSGKYCIKSNTAFADANSCGTVQGYFDAAQCAGVAP